MRGASSRSRERDGRKKGALRLRRLKSPKSVCHLDSCLSLVVVMENHLNKEEEEEMYSCGTQGTICLAYAPFSVVNGVPV